MRYASAHCAQTARRPRSKARGTISRRKATSRFWFCNRGRS